MRNYPQIFLRSFENVAPVPMVAAADGVGWTPLHEACSRASHDAVCHLLAAGADVNAFGNDNETPLHDAVRAADPEVSISPTISVD